MRHRLLKRAEQSSEIGKGKLSMAKREYSKHQKSIIKGYYENLDTLMLQKLSELVSELYLEQNPKKKDTLWQRVETAMRNLKIKPVLVEHIMSTRDVQVLAKNINDWIGRK